MSVSLVVPCYQEEAALDAFADAPARARRRRDRVRGRRLHRRDAAPRSRARGARRARAGRHARRESRRGRGDADGIAAAAATSSSCTTRTAPTRPRTSSVSWTAVRAGADVATASPFADGGSRLEVPWLRARPLAGAAAAYRVVLGPAGPRHRHLHVRVPGLPTARGSAGSRFGSDGFPAAGGDPGPPCSTGRRVVEVPSRSRRGSEGDSKMRVRRALARPPRRAPAGSRALRRSTSTRVPSDA